MFAQSRFNHSPAQLIALDTSVILAHTTYRSLMIQARELQDTVVASGTLNPDGTKVLAGANRDVEGLRDILISSAELLKRGVDRDYVDLVQYEVRFVNGRFVSAETMERDHAHLLRELPRLRALYNQGQAENAAA